MSESATSPSADVVSEQDRLASLYSYGILDTPEEEDYDRIVKLAAEICDAPMALVTLLDAERQWFKARVGLDVTETSRAVSFCQYAIQGSADVMEVPDASTDPRFADNPFVTGDPHLRLYAGAVLRDRQGRGLGTLCVLDPVAHQLSAGQLEALVTLSRQVSALIELRRESSALAHAETALAAAVDGPARRAVVTVDRELRVRGWSGDAERLYGWESGSVIGRPVVEILEVSLSPAELMTRLTSLRQQGWWEGDSTHHRRNGMPVRLRVRVEATASQGGEPAAYLLRADDVSSPDIEQLCSQTYVSVVSRMANGAALDALATSLCEVIESTFAGTSATLMVRNTATETLSVLAAPSVSPAFVAALSAVPIQADTGSCGTAAHLGEVVVTEDIAADPRWQGWRQAPRAEGFVASWSHPVIGPTGAVLGAFAVYRGVAGAPAADERQLVATLSALAAIVLTARVQPAATPHTDTLTGLLTRTGLDEALAELDGDAEVCILSVALDRFGLVNRQYGLDVGNAALRHIAQRLRDHGAGVTLMSRFGGDRFALVTEAGDCRSLADDVIGVINAPIDVDGDEVWLTASIGRARGTGRQAQTVLHAAIAASGRARRLGGNQVLDADVLPADVATAPLALVGLLHRAVATDALAVHYQPKVAIPSGDVDGFEALVRWDQPDGTPVSPAVFVALAEEIGLIGTIGERVLRRACQAAAAWPANAAGTAPRVAVNISGRQLIPGRLAATVAEALADAGLAAGRLTLELTETVLADDLDSAMVTLREVRALGVRIAIDDFGTGYSSLGYLSRFPLDELKIDLTFVDRMGQDPAVDAIVRSIVSLSHTLGLTCVAEGVERPDQLQALTELGCDAFQGYLFSPAVPAGDVPRLLAGYRPGRRAPAGRRIKQR